MFRARHLTKKKRKKKQETLAINSDSKNNTDSQHLLLVHFVYYQMLNSAPAGTALGPIVNSAVEDDRPCHIEVAAPRRPLNLTMMAMMKLMAAAMAAAGPVETPRNTETTLSVTVSKTCQPNVGMEVEYTGVDETDGGNAW